MRRLLSPLELVSKLHPDPAIQELAMDLRATIATHGAYHLGTSTDTAQRYSQIQNRLTGQNKENPLPSSRTAEAAAGVHTSHIDQRASKVATTIELQDSFKAGSSIQRPDKLSTSKAVSRMPVSDLLIEACDPDVPTRAVALRSLTQAVKEGDKEALEAQEKLLVVSTCMKLMTPVP